MIYSNVKDVALLYIITFLLFSDAKKHSDGANIAFIIDSSGSWGKTNYGRLKTFVKEVMTSVVGNVSQLEVAVVLYSYYVSAKLDFSQKFKLQSFLSIIDNLPWKKSVTRTDKALIFSSEYIFTNDTLSRRQNVPMIAILITDGKTTVFPDVVPVSNASEPLKQKSVRIFAVGIGGGVDPLELFEITERKNDVILAYSFLPIVDIADNLVNKVLSAIGKNSIQLPSSFFLVYKKAQDSRNFNSNFCTGGYQQTSS